MSRNRIIYQSESLHVGPSPSTGQHFAAGLVNPGAVNTGDNLISGLYRIQNCNYSFNVNRVPVNQFGELAAIDRVILDTPTVNLSFSYLLANFWNERMLGFNTDGLQPALSGILNRQQDDKNYFVRIAPEGQDAYGDMTDNIDVAVVGVGNGFITSYSSTASVNDFPKVDVSVEALNVAFWTGLSGKLPSIFPDNGERVTQYYCIIPTGTGSPGAGNLDISVLRPGDITLDFKKRDAADEGIIEEATEAYDAAGTNISNAKIQSYNLSFNLGREALKKLGAKYAYAREITFPIDVSLSIDAIVSDFTTGSLHDIVNSDDSYDMTINIKKPVAPGETQPVICRYKVKNAKMNSHNYSSDIGGNKMVTMEFATQIGGPRQKTVGIWFSGVDSTTNPDYAS